VRLALELRAGTRRMPLATSGDNTTVMTLDQVRARREAIRQAVQSAGGVNPRLFGSVVRGVADENSDVDILIDFQEPQPEGFAFFGALDRMERELGQLLGAPVHVSVVDPASTAGKRILAEAVPL